jgi:hypothetical protein
MTPPTGVPSPKCRYCDVTAVSTPRDRRIRKRRIGVAAIEYAGGRARRAFSRKQAWPAATVAGRLVPTIGMVNEFAVAFATVNVPL